MVLLVGWEDDAVAHLAARQGGVVANDGIVETKPKFEVHMLAQQEALGDDAVVEGAAEADDAVGKVDAVDDGGGVVGLTADGHVVQALGILDGAVVTHLGISALRGLQFSVGKLLEALHQLALPPEAGPEVGVAYGHAAEGEDATTAVLVHGLKPVVVVGGCHLVDVEQQRVVTDGVAGQHLDAMNGTVGADVAVAQTAVADALGQHQIAALDALLSNRSQRNGAIELVVVYAVEADGVCHHHTAPVLGTVALRLELCNFLWGKVAVVHKVVLSE